MRSEYYTFLDSSICRIKFEFWRDMVFLHCRPFASGLRVIRVLVRLREDIARVLRALGYVKVHVFFREDRALQQACRHLGFVTVRQRRGWVLMEADNA